MIMQSTREATRDELIQRINELQKENKYLRDENSIYRNETISKSVVQDKIEKLEKEIRQYNNYAKQGEETDVEFYEKIANEAKIQILYELLEGENTNV